MTLSVSTVRKLADTLAPEVLEDLLSNHDVVTVLQELIPDIISKHMGEVDEDLLFELSMCIMDKIYQCAACSSGTVTSHRPL